jgi:integrase/recombinase XerD
MDNEIAMLPSTRAMLKGGVLEPHIADYCARLRLGRYAANTRRVYLCCVAHFARWLTTEGLGLDAVTDETVTRFVADHLPRCDCPPPVRRTPHEIKAALAHLIQNLRSSGVISLSLRHGDHIGSELAAFDRYMDEVCGFTPSTRRHRLGIVARFLVAKFGDGPLDLAFVTGADVRLFVVGSKAGRTAETINAMGGALRCYGRFRKLVGAPIESLAAAIPRAAHWRLSSLPEVRSQSEIDQLLASFGDDTPSGKRGYAMVRCLADLGLRTSEVAGLRLDDIDWQAGTLRITRGKARRADVLPLPPKTGQAIVDYLHIERPQTSNRAVFVRHVAPYDEPITTNAVRNVVRAAYRRCGWAGSRLHILRHSVASRLLQHGTPLKEIADVLRHRSLDTSAIYAKVDTVRLAAVALPWPETMP